jgi:hypothetical protein
VSRIWGQMSTNRLTGISSRNTGEENKGQDPVAAVRWPQMSGAKAVEADNFSKGKRLGPAQGDCSESNLNGTDRRHQVDKEGRVWTVDKARGRPVRRWWWRTGYRHRGSARRGPRASAAGWCCTPCTADPPPRIPTPSESPSESLSRSHQCHHLTALTGPVHPPPAATPPVCTQSLVAPPTPAPINTMLHSRLAPSMYCIPPPVNEHLQIPRSIISSNRRYITCKVQCTAPWNASRLPTPCCFTLLGHSGGIQYETLRGFVLAHGSMYCLPPPDPLRPTSRPPKLP